MRGDQFQKWALGAEIFGAVAVVVTLGFLVFQMRENTNALQAQTFQALMQELNEWRTQGNDPERLILGQKHRQEGWQNLTSVEQRLIRMPSVILWSIYESAYYANERGALGEREWIRFDAAICRGFGGRAGDDIWEPEGFTPMTEVLTPDFVDYIESGCQ